MAEKPDHIVCAVRGSPQSRATVTRAIDLALEHDARLTFFYAVDAEFLARTHRPWPAQRSLPRTGRNVRVHHAHPSRTGPSGAAWPRWIQSSARATSANNCST